MTGLVLVTTPAALPLFTLTLLVASLAGIGIAFAPQAVKRDRRVLAAGLVILGMSLIGHRVFAADDVQLTSDICKYFPYTIECLLGMIW